MNQGIVAALADRYLIERELGQGGMATVYLARDLKHEREVAIKVLRPELAAVIGADRFVLEIKTTAALSHPNILPLFDSGAADGQLYYVMPYIAGETLRTRLARETQLAIDDVVRITRDVADALDYAHRHGVIHRDIKPENILLYDGRPMVMDFGIALAMSTAGDGRMTDTGLSLGTPHYMSPEQAMGDRHIDARTDVYSLGAVVYEMLAGEPPHTGPTSQAIIAKLLTEPAIRLRVVRPAVPEAMDSAVARALAITAADRFSSVREFAERLEQSRTTTPSDTRRAPRRPIEIAAAMLLLSVIGVAAISRLVRRSEPPPRYTLVPLTNSGHADAPAISPDGSTVAYVSGTCQAFTDMAGCHPELKVQDVRTGTALTIASGARYYGMPQWNQDGSTLAYATEPAGGGQQAILLNRPFGGTPQPLPGQSAIGFVGRDTVLLLSYGAHQSMIMTAFSTTNGSISDSVVLPPLTSVRLSPNGRWLAGFALGSGSSLGRTQLLVFDRTGRLVDTAATVIGWASLAWGSGSRQLFYSSPGPSTTPLMEVAVNPNTGHRQAAARIAISDLWHVWRGRGARQFAVAVDGGMIAYAQETADYQIWAYDAGLGANTPRLHSTPTAAGPIALSPDGTRIARVLHGMGSDPTPDALVVDSWDGSTEQLIANIPDGNGAYWTPDGGALYWTTVTNGRVQMTAIDVTTRMVRWTLTLSPDELRNRPIPLLSGDFAEIRERGRAVRRFDLRGDSALVTLPEGYVATSITPGPDGNAVLVRARTAPGAVGGASFWRLPADAPTMQLVATFDSTWKIGQAWWSHDGVLHLQVGAAPDGPGVFEVAGLGRHPHRALEWSAIHEDFPSSFSSDGRRAVRLAEDAHWDIWLARPVE